MATIKLTQGKFALVDDTDFDWLNQWRWITSDHGYARREIKRNKFIYMHQMINNTPKGFDTDHINRNKLDNRRNNLRSVNKHQNSINRGKNINNTSGFKGVHWIEKIKKWEAFIHSNYKKYYLGVFNNIDQAILARKNAERIYHAI